MYSINLISFLLGLSLYLCRPCLLGHPHALPPHLIEQRLVSGRGEGNTLVALGGGFWEVSPPSCVFSQSVRYNIEALSFHFKPGH